MDHAKCTRKINKCSKHETWQQAEMTDYLLFCPDVFNYFLWHFSGHFLDYAVGLVNLFKLVCLGVFHQHLVDEAGESFRCPLSLVLLHLRARKENCWKGKKGTGIYIYGDVPLAFALVSLECRFRGGTGLPLGHPPFCQKHNESENRMCGGLDKPLSGTNNNNSRWREQCVETGKPA